MLLDGEIADGWQTPVAGFWLLAGSKRLRPIAIPPDTINVLSKLDTQIGLQLLFLQCIIY